jgi:hypothetical protein
MDALLYLFIIMIFVFAILGGVLRVALPLLLSYAVFKRQRAAMIEQQRLLDAGQSQTAPLGEQPAVSLPPIIGQGVDPNNIHMPGGPSVVNGQVFVPGVTHQWKR